MLGGAKEPVEQDFIASLPNTLVGIPPLNGGCRLHTRPSPPIVPFLFVFCLMGIIRVGAVCSRDFYPYVVCRKG